MAELIHGRNLIISMNDEVIAACKTCSIQMDQELIETSSPTDGRFRNYIGGRIGWSISSSHLVTHGTILSVPSMISQKVHVKFFFAENEKHTEDGVIMFGDAIISKWQIDAAVGSLAKGSFTFTGTGELTNTDAYIYLVPKGNDELDAAGQTLFVRKYSNNDPQ